MIEVEIQRKTRKVQVQEDDIISLAEAAQVSGRTVQAIGAMVDAGKLPWLEWGVIAKTEGRTQRFTRRSAVLALPAKSNRGPNTKPRKPAARQ